MKFVIAKKRNILSLIVLIVLSSTIAGCTNKSLVQNQSNAESNNSTASGIQTDEKKNKTIYIDEKLDEKLYISAEFRMPSKDFYEYSTKLKKFDYNKIRKVLNKSKELTDQNAYMGGDNQCGSFKYERNDKANHLDTYCCYASEKGLGKDEDLSFMSKEDAVMKIKKLIGQFEIGAELGNPDVVAMDKTDFENVKGLIMNDEEYKGILSAKNYGEDKFDKNLEVYKMDFPVEVNGVPVYGNNEPVLRLTRETIIAQQTGVTVLLSDKGIEMITITGSLEPYDDQKRKTDIIGEEGIKDAITEKFGDIILADEYKAVNIWMEYFPLLKDGSFTDVDLIPVWCVDFEINGKMQEDSIYTLRINAITGDEVS